MARVIFYFVLVLSFINNSELFMKPKPYYRIELTQIYFEDFIRNFQKIYRSLQEKEERLSIFIDNLRKINFLNMVENTTVFAINEFTDLTAREFIENHTGVSKTGRSGLYPVISKCVPFPMNNLKPAPSTFDWTKFDAVTVPKNQKKCGSCWAFSAAGSIESQFAIKYHIKLDLSEQQLVDCDTRSYGCDGGFPVNAFSYLLENGGIMLEADYPYKNLQTTCKANKNKIKVKLTNCYTTPVVDEEQLKNLLYTYGPLNFVIDAESLHMYSEGILKVCKKGDLNHAVLLVGYGTDDGVDFWKVKNSWGTKYGEKGFFRIIRGQNACALMESYYDVPIIE